MSDIRDSENPVGLTLMAATDGGYIVVAAQRPALFAGKLEECLTYMRGFFEGTKQPNGDRKVIPLKDKP
jgi:hypothetical protein